jgi:hypothetical protein
LKRVLTQEAFNMNVINISVIPALKVVNKPNFVNPVPDQTSPKVKSFTLDSSPEILYLLKS